jgi:23S rRNA pseudouridine2605 synthase
VFWGQWFIYSSNYSRDAAAIMRNFGKKNRNSFSKETREQNGDKGRRGGTSRYPDRSDSKPTSRSSSRGRSSERNPRFDDRAEKKGGPRKRDDFPEQRKARFAGDKLEKKPQYDIKAIQKGAPQADEIRLNRYIANAGVCSRREADALIGKGEISVNGKVVTELGLKVKRSDKVAYKGRFLNPEKPVYLLLNKPKDYITTTDDPFERKTVMRLIENACEERVFPVGRLDRNTTGLLLFTNDGELSDKITHPSNEIKKNYKETFDKPLTKNDL